MSPRQVADDPGRQMRKVYLGPPNMRFPMDWTFEECAFALGVLLLGTALLVFAIPAGLVVAVVTWRVGGWVSRLTNPDNPRRNFRIFAGAVALLCLLLVSANPITWLQPLFFPFAILAGIYLPIYAVKSKGNFLNWNRPFAYWLRLPRLMASGPREITPNELDPTPLMLGMSLEKADVTRHLDPAVKPTIIKSPSKGGKSPKRSNVEHRLVPLNIAPPVQRGPIRHSGRHKLIERTDQGFRVGATEYRVEWTF